MATKFAVDAGTAKLAGLLIDLLHKVRKGQITMRHLEGINCSSTDSLDRLADAALRPPTYEKFVEVLDLGIITVPEGYVHATQLDTFIEVNRKSFSFVDDNITDENFSPKATTQLTPGRQIRVKLYKKAVSGSTTSAELMDFLRAQPRNVFLGAHGITLLWPEREKLPKSKGTWYFSFDEQTALWQDALGNHRVPRLFCGSGGRFEFDLGYFEGDGGSDDYLLDFSDVSVEALA